MTTTTFYTIPEKVEAIRYTGEDSFRRMKELWPDADLSHDGYELIIRWAGIWMLTVKKSMWLVKHKDGFSAYTETNFLKKFRKKEE
jgi:hypothetical protein